MKKFLSLLLGFGLCISLCGCLDEDSPSNGDPDTNEEQEEQEEEKEEQEISELGSALKTIKDNKANFCVESLGYVIQYYDDNVSVENNSKDV